MKRRGKRAAPNHERWLISYADFMTLLFALFVVLFAAGQADKKKQVQLSASIESAFSQMGIFEARAKTPEARLADGAGAGEPPVRELDDARAQDEMKAVMERMREAAGKELASGVIGMRETNGNLVISLAEAGFFESGAAEIRESAVPVLERIADALPESALRVEGHTDDVPIRTVQYASNWELSSARASSIARLLLVHPNVRPELVSVAGYAEFHPVASNETPEGRARNRRLDIVVLAPGRQCAEVKWRRMIQVRSGKPEDGEATSE